VGGTSIAETVGHGIDNLVSLMKSNGGVLLTEWGIEKFPCLIILNGELDSKTAWGGGVKSWSESKEGCKIGGKGGTEFDASRENSGEKDVLTRGGFQLLIRRTFSRRKSSNEDIAGDKVGEVVYDYAIGKNNDGAGLFSGIRLTRQRVRVGYYKTLHSQVGGGQREEGSAPAQKNKDRGRELNAGGSGGKCALFDWIFSDTATFLGFHARGSRRRGRNGGEPASKSAHREKSGEKGACRTKGGRNSGRCGKGNIRRRADWGEGKRQT